MRTIIKLTEVTGIVLIDEKPPYEMHTGNFSRSMPARKSKLRFYIGDKLIAEQMFDKQENAEKALEAYRDKLQLFEII